MDYGNGNYPPIPYFNTGVYPGYDMNNPPIYFPQHPSNLLRDPFRSNSPFAQEQAPYPIEQDQGRWNFPHDYQNLPMRPYRQVVSVTNPEQDDLSVERSYTPTFQGSGPPLFPDETHDEMRRAVAFAMTAEQFDLDEKLQLLLNQLNLLSGDMKECMQELTAYPDKLNDPTRTFPVKPSPNSVKAPIVGDDPRRVIVNTSNKLIKVPKVVNASEECETEPQSNDILVVDSSKQSVRSLTDWVPLANGKKRKVNVVLNESNESVSPQSKKKTEAGSKIGSSSVLDEQRDVKDEVQWYEQTLVKPIPIKIEETDDALNCDTYSTIDLTNIQSDSGTVIIDDSSDTRATSFDMDIEPISRVESCQASPSDAALEKSAELKSLESAKNENLYPSKASYSLRIIKGQRIPGGSRECYANIEGKCTSGIFCRFDHPGQPKHCCSRLLRGLCRPDNKACSASHTLLPHQYPVCTFYLREDCSSWPNCKLLHAKHFFRTAYCGDFGRGCCFKGDDPPQVDVNVQLSLRRRRYFRPDEVGSVPSEDMSIEAETLQHDVQEEIVTETKDIHDGELLRTQRAASVNNRSWHTLIPGKRVYNDLQNEDDMDEEMDDHFVQQQQYRRPPPEGPRKRGRPRKFPPGVPPPEFLSKVQQRNMDSHEVDYEDDRHQGASSLNSRGVSRSHMVGRGGSTMAGAPPRLAQPGHMRMPPPVGQAAHIASQRLPSLTGGPPKENKPLKVVTLLPNSRRNGGGPSRPIVSGIRTLGQPSGGRQRASQLPIEKQAEQIINQAVKLGDRLVSGQSLGEFNRLIEQLNSQITSLQDDNRKLNGLYSGLIEFKDNRIKQLETQVERLQSELSSSVRNWQAQLLMPEISEGETKEQDGLQSGVRNRTVVQSSNGNWVITDRYVRENDNGEVTEEIIEQEVDPQTFLRMEQESFVSAEDEQGVHEEVIDEQQLSNGEHQLD